MSHYETTIEVPTEPKAAFAYLADFGNATAWDPAIVASARTDTGPLGEGSTFRVTVAFFGRRLELDYVIERYESPRSLVLVGRNKTVEARTSYTIDANGVGSHISSTADVKLKGALRLLDKGLQVSFTNMGEKAAAGLRGALGG